MSEKIYKCKVWTSGIIHVEARDEQHVLNMISRFFATYPDIKVESVEELDKGETENLGEDDVFNEKHMPNLTIN